MLNLNANIVYHPELIAAQREIKKQTDIAIKKQRPLTPYDAREVRFVVLYRQYQCNQTEE